MSSEKSDWSHWICLLDSAYTACVMALSIAPSPDSGDLAEISINAELCTNECSMIYMIYPIKCAWGNANFRVSILQNPCSGPWYTFNDVLQCAKISTATDSAAPNLRWITPLHMQSIQRLKGIRNWSNLSPHPTDSMQGFLRYHTFFQKLGSSIFVLSGQIYSYPRMPCMEYVEWGLEWKL